MAGITLEIAQAHLDTWLAADTAVSSGQRYKINSGATERELWRSDAAEIREKITYWNDLVIKLSSRAGGRGRMRTIVPAN